MDADLSLSINGAPVQQRVPAQRLLLQLLRDDLHLTGTHHGCDTAQCGACTVLVDSVAVKACNMLALQAEGCDVRTIESLAAPGAPLHPMQQAFTEHHALQCGFCTPGMVMRGVAMAGEPVAAEPGAVRQALAGNLCRCTGYQGIVDAVCQGLRCMREAA